MTEERKRQLLEKGLALQGGLYTVDDLAEALRSGAKQGFLAGDSFAVTSIGEYPRRRVLFVELVVGELGDTADLDAQVEAFARDQGCTLLITDARPGWRAHTAPKWRETRIVMHKELH